MRKLLTLLVLTLPIQAQVLDQYRDHNRVLLLFAPSAADPRYLQQLALFRHHRVEFKDRDLVLLPVLTSSGPAQDASTVRILAPLSDTDQQSLRARFRIAPNEFAALLLGKDGGEKLRTTKPLTPARLFATIDAMPMRQNEIRQNEMRRKQ